MLSRIGSIWLPVRPGFFPFTSVVDAQQDPGNVRRVRLGRLHAERASFLTMGTPDCESKMLAAGDSQSISIANQKQPREQTALKIPIRGIRREP